MYDAALFTCDVFRATATRISSETPSRLYSWISWISTPRIAGWIGPANTSENPASENMMTSYLGATLLLLRDFIQLNPNFPPVIIEHESILYFPIVF